MNVLLLQSKAQASRRGVALVTTLVMLAVVTLMAVVFLSVTRRERVRTTLTEEQDSAKFIADAAIARVQAQIAANMMANHNPIAMNLMVSTNYQGAKGYYEPGLGAKTTNVGYTTGSPFGPLVSGNNHLQAIANLQHDPRPPVFVRTNDQGAMDFRFWLDFNRNRRFETNGFIVARDANNRPIGPINNIVGDPEWIGVLEHPHLPHSETNRFIGRYAYVVLPTGRNLDINTIHNHVRRTAPDDLSIAGNGYSRGQGVGPWEMNLAAFLRDLNTNLYAWPRGSYTFNPATAVSAGSAFDDARSILSYRYATNRLTLLAANKVYHPNSIARSQMDMVDWYADSVPRLDASGYVSWPENDDLTRPWPGSINTNLYTDVQELFTRTSLHTSDSLRNPLRASSYDNYTFYRALEQIGVDSSPSLTWYNPYLPGKTFTKVQLNYTNLADTIPTNLVEHVNEYTTNSIPLSPQTNLFMLLADNFLKASISNSVQLVTNSNGRTSLATNYYIGETRVRPDISVTNIQLFHVGTRAVGGAFLDLSVDAPQPWGFRTNYFNTNREYGATVHRLLQVAANIYDQRTNDAGRLARIMPYAPSVFRPVFTRTSTNILISGFRRELTGGYIMSNRWYDVDDWMYREGTTLGNTTTTNLLGINFWGVPSVIGVKKGYPNFNEFMVQTTIGVARKLEVHKSGTSGPLTLTNQSHLIGISNLFGMEAWNSYTNAYTRPFVIRAMVITTNALYNFPSLSTNGGASTVSNRLVYTGSTFIFDPTKHPGFTGQGFTNWAGATNIPNPNPDSFFVPIFTNQIYVTNSYYVGRPPFLIQATNKNQYVHDGTFETPRLHLHMTNRVLYTMLDSVSGHVLDFVTLRVTNFVDIGALITGRPNSAEGDAMADVTGGGVREDEFWDTNRVAGAGGITRGVLRQLQVSMGEPEVQDNFWRNYNPQIEDRKRSIDLFRVFMGTNELYETSVLAPPPVASTRHQAPFTPSRKLLFTSSYQVNDPLVHSLQEDLFDSVYSTFNIENFVRVNPPNRPGVDNLFHNIGKLNKRYRPWGGDPKADPLALSAAAKDPLIFRSDDWRFPIDDPTVSSNRSFRFPTVGWLGRVHRGSPWQTIYMKADAVDPKLWTNRWGSSHGTHPSMDFVLFDTVTTAPHENAAKGLLGVNQNNFAAWSALLSGITVWSNSVPDGNFPPDVAVKRQLAFTPVAIDPAAPQLAQIVNSINEARSGWVTTVASNKVTNVFFNSGAILSARALTDASPYLNTNINQRYNGIPDPVYEAIPQQIMSLVQQEQPRFTVYAFGQTLRPAPRSAVTDGNFYNLVTNYQVSGEVAVKTLLRFEGELSNPSNPLRSIIESYEVLPPE